jgi:serine/threonine protein kinase
MDSFMALNSIDTLLAVLRRAELLAPEQVDEIVRELVPHYHDPLDLCEYLVQIDWLTSYQLQLLLAGQYRKLTLGPFQILDQLGEGGLSEVFKAWDTVHGRLVALKVLRPDLARGDAVRQFQREHESITRLSHPNIIKTYQAGTQGKLHFFAMEFVEGMDLERFIGQVGPLCVEMACDYARQAATGLQHAHQSGLVHRDLKPANLFLLNPPLPGLAAVALRKTESVVKILDWGLARCVRESEQEVPAESEEETEREKGALIGTADYIAPEQARDATLVDIRADIYSLGCVLYYLLTGQPPFPAATLMQKLLMHQTKEPPSVRALRDDVPEELDAIIRKMLAKDPIDRYQIPLLVVTPLRRFSAPALSSTNGMRLGTPTGNGYRPGSAPSLNRPGSSATLPVPSAPGTPINLPRPGTQPTLKRPGQNGRA